MDPQLLALFIFLGLLLLLIGIAELLHRRLSESVATRSDWVKAAHGCTMDLLHDRAADDDKKHGDTGLQDYF